MFTSFNPCLNLVVVQKCVQLNQFYTYLSHDLVASQCLSFKTCPKTTLCFSQDDTKPQENSCTSHKIMKRYFLIARALWVMSSILFLSTKTCCSEHDWNGAFSLFTLPVCFYILQRELITVKDVIQECASVSDFAFVSMCRNWNSVSELRWYAALMRNIRP